jgi:hypothetical protein
MEGILAIGHSQLRKVEQGRVMLAAASSGYKFHPVFPECAEIGSFVSDLRSSTSII